MTRTFKALIFYVRSQSPPLSENCSRQTRGTLRKSNQLAFKAMKRTVHSCRTRSLCRFGRTTRSTDSLHQPEPALVLEFISNLRQKVVTEFHCAELLYLVFLKLRDNDERVRCAAFRRLADFPMSTLAHYFQGSDWQLVFQHGFREEGTTGHVQVRRNESLFSLSFVGEQVEIVFSKGGCLLVTDGNVP